MVNRNFLLRCACVFVLAFVVGFLWRTNNIKMSPEMCSAVEERMILEYKIRQLDAAIGALYDAQSKKCLGSYSEGL